jgi:hypothetical protein
MFTEANASRNFDWAHVLVHPLRLRPPEDRQSPFDYFVKIAETPSPSSQDSIASAFFLRSSFGRDNE